VAVLFLLSLFLLSFKVGIAEEAKTNIFLKSVFDETETVLVLAPSSQVSWARNYASQHGYRSSAKEIQAAIKDAFPKDPPGMHAQTSLITQLIIMGDIVGALRDYAVLQDKDTRQFTRLLVKKLDAVRKARSTVIRNFARTKPPRAYAGQNPQQAALAQDRSSRYTQFVQVSTQLMNELQQTERELMDALQTMQRDLQTFWEAYASMRDEEFRTNERVMTLR
jgi:hypothetical protein